jgi:hypothetical protein
MRSLLVFETDDGRTGAGADASNSSCVFISFFLKPLSVRPPFAARFTTAQAGFSLIAGKFRGQEA